MGLERLMTRRVYTWAAATLLFFATLTMATADAMATAEPKRVLLLHSFGPNFSPYSEYVAKLRRDLARESREPMDIYEVALATARFTED